MSQARSAEHFEQVAIIGMSGRFPGAADPAGLWENLCRGVEAVRFLTDQELLSAGVESELLHKPSYVKAAILLEGVELFDAKFFGFTPREAELTDPQHRVFLETSWEALENAGYDPERSGSQIGVFAGAGMNLYFNSILASSPGVFGSLNELQRLIVADKDFLATRVSYKLNLKGPSLTVQTACSTSLVAVHLACQSLLNGECDMALAGGVSIRIPQVAGYLREEGSILSPDGHCRAFDADGQGMVIGSGAGVVVLKRLGDALADGDCIRAVIKASCINNDGSDKVGYTAPSVSGQAKVIATAQALAGASAEDITYVETHGTGTSLGDPIEISALTQAFRATTQKKGYCAIGSLKTNIGHLDAAAGVAGLIKVALALQNHTLPPSLNYYKPNPAIDFTESPFYVQRSLSEWPAAGGPRLAGVSSFGIGGTNAHLVVEEAPPQAQSGRSRSWQLVPISAKTTKALETATDNLARFIDSNPGTTLADIAFTLQNGRKVFPHRRFLVARGSEDAGQVLKSRDTGRVHTGYDSLSDCAVTLMFPGQAAQYVNMGLDLYRTEAAFRATVDSCCGLLRPHLGFDLREVLYPRPEETSRATEQLEQTAVTQPAMFVMEYALASLWMKWGLHPEAMIGHSVGEYVAACIAGIFSLEDSLSIVASRGRLMQGMARGSMMAVRLGEEDVQPFLGRELSLATINAPSSCVVAGTNQSIKALQDRLEERGISCKVLQTSHAFHSWMMEPMIGPFREFMQTVKRSPPTVPCISNVTGTWLEPEQAVDPGYWASHLRNTVRFADGVGELFRSANRILLEVGPGQTLSSLAKQHPARGPHHVVLSSLPGTAGQAPDSSALGTALGQLWLAGAYVDWRAFSAGQNRRRVPLPTYPFERQRCWIDAVDRAAVLPFAPANGQARSTGATVGSNGVDAAVQDEHENSSAERLGLHAAYVAPSDDLEKGIAGIWTELLGIQKIGSEDDFFELGGDSLLATRLLSRLLDKFQVGISLKDFFSTSTVRGLSKSVRGVLLEEIEKLAEDEAQQRAEGGRAPVKSEIEDA